MNDDDYEIRKHMSLDQQIRLYRSYKTWHPNRKQLYKYIEYNSDGERHGQYKRWWYDGKLWVSRCYKNDRIYGESLRWYDATTTLAERCDYNGWSCEFEFWYPDGKPMKHGFLYLHGKPMEHGFLNHSLYKHGEEHGEFMQWYGTLVRHELYEHGKKVMSFRK